MMMLRTREETTGVTLVRICQQKQMMGLNLEEVVTIFLQKIKRISKRPLVTWRPLAWRIVHKYCFNKEETTTLLSGIFFSSLPLNFTIYNTALQFHKVIYHLDSISISSNHDKEICSSCAISISHILLCFVLLLNNI